MPALAELGFPDMDKAPIVSVVAPRQTPRDVVARLAAEVVKAVRDPEVSQKLTGLGLEVIGNTPEQFGAYLEAEARRMLPLIKSFNIRLD